MAVATSISQDETRLELPNGHMIFGPPGTGKTRTLTTIVANAVKKYGADALLVASYTVAAAKELASRAHEVPSDHVRTLHSFGYAVIGKHPIAEDRVGEWNTYVRERGRSDFMLSESGAKKGGVDEDDGEIINNVTEGDKTFALYRMERNAMRPRAYWSADVVVFDMMWESWKHQHNYVDFCDMIALPVEQRLPPPGNFRCGIFDEVQDFTRLEMALAEWWASQMDEAYFALDDDQTVYRFKGADAEACLGLRVPERNRRILEQSWRVPRKVQRYAEGWVQTLSVREPKTYRPRNEAGDVRFIAADTVTRRAGTYEVPEALIEDMLKQGYLSRTKTVTLYDHDGNVAGTAERPWTVMFLANCGYMLDPLKRVLRGSGIPYHNPLKPSRPDWNPLTPAAGVSSAQRVLDFLRISPDVYGAQARAWNIMEFWQWTDALNVTGVLRRGMKAEIEHYKANLGNDRDALTAPLQLVGDPDDSKQPGLLRWMEEEALGHALDGDLDWFVAHLSKSKFDAMQFPLAIVKKDPTLLMRKPQVIIGTIHSVKGGEADVVYLWPDIGRRGAAPAIDQNILNNIGAEKFQHYVRNEWRLHRDTQTRLFYVGMTRAFHTLVVCPPATQSLAGRRAELPNPYWGNNMDPDLDKKVAEW